MENPDGSLQEYFDPTLAPTINQDRINKEKRLMDCVDCHNRATHIFQSPSDLIDTAIAEGAIDSSLPYIKREGMLALNTPSRSLDQAYSRVQAIEQFYATSYPAVYREKKAAIDRAIDKLEEIARLTTFPEMHVTWTTYVDQLGHQETPGCFRCHGKLVAESGPVAGQTVSSGCSSCHYALPELLPTPPTGGPPSLPPNHSLVTCNTCHLAGLAGAPTLPDSHAGFAEQMCLECHEPSTPPVTPTPSPTATPTPMPTATPTPVAGPPTIPAGHPASNCAACHGAGLGGAPVLPPTHAGYTDAICEGCHKR